MSTTARCSLRWPGMLLPTCSCWTTRTCPASWSGALRSISLPTSGGSAWTRRATTRRSSPCSTAAPGCMACPGATRPWWSPTTRICSIAPRFPIRPTTGPGTIFSVSRNGSRAIPTATGRSISGAPPSTPGSPCGYRGSGRGAVTCCAPMAGAPRGVSTRGPRSRRCAGTPVGARARGWRRGSTTRVTRRGPSLVCSRAGASDS